MKISEIAAKYSLDFVILHGSQATGKTISPNPDIDIAVYRNKKNPDTKDIIEVTTDFIKVFGDNVDVKFLNKTDPLFKLEVVKDGILLYGDPHEYEEFKLYIYRLYDDAKPLFENLDKILKVGIKELGEIYA